MIRLPSRVALAAALASIGALAAPGAANAAVTTAVAGSTLTVTSDAVGDTITFSVVNNHIAVGGVETTLPADDNTTDLVVNAGDGVDTVDAGALVAVNYRTLTVNGGAGNDLITGGADVDTLRGDAGDDRVVGSKGNDRVAEGGGMFGGDGNDVLVWNNGDGTDTHIGDAGTDEVEVNASPTGNDVMTAKPGAVAGQVRFDRTSTPGAFGIDLSAERLTVNGLDGDDTFAPDPAAPTGLTALTSLTINGGSGIDSLTGVDGADQINGGIGADEVNGGPGADQLNGGDGGDVLSGGDGADLVRGGDDTDTVAGNAGDDRLIGDRGTDAASGDDGDDVLVWNNGDGTDSNEGDTGFDRVEVNGSAVAGDVFKLGSDAKFERTNLVPFSISIDKPTTEAIAVNGGGGDDQFVVSPGLSGFIVAADGGSGNDTLTGAGENDSFFGGSGNDTLAGGGGSDLLDGDEGDDALFARDLTGDLVRGGVGNDSAQTDSVHVDATSGVEALDATPLPAPIPAPAGDRKALLPKLGKVKVIRSRGKLIARVPLSCPAAETGGCKTTLRLETARTVKLGSVRAQLLLGSKSVKLRPAQRSTVSIRLARGAAALAKRGRLAARVRIATSDAAGNFATRSAAVGLRIPR